MIILHSRNVAKHADENIVFFRPTTKAGEGEFGCTFLIFVTAKVNHLTTDLENSFNYF